MIEIYGNLWDATADWRGITTNGYVKSNGECVMGRGCAAQAKKRYPRLPRELGERIRESGNVIHMFPQYRIFTFPVKHVWSEPADPCLIAAMAEYLGQIASATPTARFVLPRPGCGNGQLSWDAVRPLLLDLPDNVAIIEWPV